MVPPLFLLSGALAPSGAFGAVGVETGMAGVMEGELVESAGNVYPAAAMESSCGCDVPFHGSSVSVVALIMELVPLTSPGSGDSYSLGGWTSA